MRYPTFAEWLEKNIPDNSACISIDQAWQRYTDAIADMGDWEMEQRRDQELSERDS